MSEQTLQGIASHLRETSIAAAWRQWAALGAVVDADPAARSIVDPEALLLISLCFGAYERRFHDLVTSWSKQWIRLVSVQRIKNLMPLFSRSTAQAVGEFAGYAVGEAKDHRWRSLAEPGADFLGESRGKKWQPLAGFTSDAALMLRLRQGFGVNLRADLLAFLLSRRAGKATVAELATVGYTKAAVRRTADEMAAARFILKMPDAPSDYYEIDREGWLRLLGILPDLPTWDYWQLLFGMASRIDEWAATAADRSVTAMARDILGQDLIASDWAQLARLQPFLRSRPGDTVSFDRQVELLCDRIGQRV